MLRSDYFIWALGWPLSNSSSRKNTFLGSLLDPVSREAFWKSRGQGSTSRFAQYFEPKTLHVKPNPNRPGQHRFAMLLVVMCLMIVLDGFFIIS